MKIINIRYVIISALILFLGANTQCDDLTNNNQIAYELAALVAYNYVQDYSYQKGAGSAHCSAKGLRICKALSSLVERTRLFTNPTRDDLKTLSRETSNAFRMYDLSGGAADRNAFVSSLTNLLQATLPLLSAKDATECRSLIQQLQKAK